jgi:hypothetical protein
MVFYFVFCVFRTLSLTCLAPRKEVPISFADLEQFLVGCSQLEVIICLLKDLCKGLFVSLYILLVVFCWDCFCHAFVHIKHASLLLLGASYLSFESEYYWASRRGGITCLLDNTLLDNLDNAILNKFNF